MRGNGSSAPVYDGHLAGERDVHHILRPAGYGDNKMSYVWDNDCRFFRRENGKAIEYSDGQDVEARIEAIICNASDRSVSSTELVRQITDWPSLYHLGKLRHCLLRPLNIKPGDRVLEIGCGCGALTRYLGEIGADTIALEGSPGRARIAAARCSDLPNVKVYVDNLLDLDIPGAFDWVLMVGVLEYAPVYAGSEEPVDEYLLCASKYLTPNGKLVIAIENKLGLKYWNGCCEDHLGKRYVGVEGLYRPGEPVTFGRRELVELLNKFGFGDRRFYYPYPDYKLPSVILTESGLTCRDFDVADLLARAHARDYSDLQYRNFDDALVLDQLAKNGLLAELSNSFLVVAGHGPAVSGEEQTLASAYSADRIPEFATVTTLRRTDRDIRVSKEPMFPALQRVRTFASGLTLTNILGETPYIYGRQLLWPILRARAESRSRPSPVAELFRPWFEYLMGFASLAEGANGAERGNRLADLRVEFKFFDCTPFNVIQNDGSLYLIDREWTADRSAALGWVVTRGVLWSLAAGVPAADRLQPLAQVVEELCASVGLLVTTEEIQQWMQEEADFQTSVTGRTIQPFSVLISSGGLRRIQDEVDHLGESLKSSGEERESLRWQLEEARLKISALTAEMPEENAVSQSARRNAESARIHPDGISRNLVQSEDGGLQLALQLEAARVRISELTAEKHELAAALQRSRKDTDYAQGELENRSVEFAVRLEQAWKERADALMRLEKSEGREISAMRVELAASHSERMLLAAESIRITNERNELCAEVRRITDIISRCQSESNSLRESLRIAQESSAAELNARLGVQSENDALRESLRIAQESSAAELNARLGVQSENDALRESLRIARESLVAELSTRRGIEQSKSWRVTAPLRRFMLLLRSLSKNGGRS